ncbi:helix-turn-helix domain-containing protein [Streptomyces sp. NBC_01594]|uniref:AlbA family DNA-binding domain-containing protein n=1 Tax=Streptomyces sp. NBC_01594 TaxID=2975890 RepID=UPI0038665927
MAAEKSVTFNRDLHKLILANGQSRSGIDSNDFLVHSDDLQGMRPTDLKEALRRTLSGDEVVVHVTHDDNVDEEYSMPEPISFRFSEGQLAISVGHSSDQYDEDKMAAAEFSTLLAPYLKRRRASVTKVEMNPHYVNPLIWDIEICGSPRGRDMADLFKVGEGALALLQAFESGELTRETTLDLLRSGNAQVLIGQEEGPWLDVKSAHYDLQSPSGKISIAQAVARFANAEHGGIVVVGMRGKKVPGGEIINSICPVPVDGRTLRSYQTAIEQHLYPPPDYLDIEVVPVDGGGLVVLHIPPQPEEHKPFLVHGAILDGKIEGAFISIVRRRGESSIPITAPAVHTTLAAGRALLRRGELPRNPE